MTIDFLEQSVSISLCVARSELTALEVHHVIIFQCSLTKLQCIVNRLCAHRLDANTRRTDLICESFFEQATKRKLSGNNNVDAFVASMFFN